jgi:hypothetical protein
MGVNLVQSIVGSVQKRLDTVHIEKAIEFKFSKWPIFGITAYLSQNIPHIV